MGVNPGGRPVPADPARVDGPEGTIGFTISGGQIATIDLTLDPDRLEGPNQQDESGLPDEQNRHDGEATLLSLLGGRPGSAAERIIRCIKMILHIHHPE